MMFITTLELQDTWKDGSGTGEKDTDTILAQLADGEFVSRTDAVFRRWDYGRCITE
jgi:hypothetical protein